MYISFTTLSIALHLLFLSREGVNRIFQSKEMKLFLENRFRPLYLAFFAIWLLLLLINVPVAFIEGNAAIATALALPLLLPFCYLVIRYGYSLPIDNNNKQSHSRPSMLIGAIVTLLFFINCTLPYMGLKTAQAMNMFANIRMEAGVSNHLIFSSAPTWFDYQDKVATIINASDDSGLLWYKEGSRQL